MKKSHLFAYFLLLMLLACNNKAPAPTLPDNGLPAILGDFNGDGSSEQLRLFVYSANGDTLDQQRLQDSINKSEMAWLGRGELRCADARIPTFAINGDFIGLWWLHNEGDLNGDQADDIAFIRDWETSGIRDIEVFSLQNGKWKSLAAFMVNITLLEMSDLPNFVKKGSQPNSLQVREYDPMVDSLWQLKTISF